MKTLTEREQLLKEIEEASSQEMRLKRELNVILKRRQLKEDYPFFYPNWSILNRQLDDCLSRINLLENYGISLQERLKTAKNN